MDNDFSKFTNDELIQGYEEIVKFLGEIEKYNEQLNNG